LIIPAVLVGVGLWFNRQQRKQELQIADRRAQDEALADRRAQDEALQAYLDQFSDMLIPSSKDLPSLYKARPGDSLSSVARAWTLTVLPRLDGDRKARVVQFLYKSGLISRERPVLALNEANLIEAELSGANLMLADLSKANISEANLKRAILIDADLTKANLRGANLSGANLRGAYGVTNEELAHQTSALEGAIMPSGQKYEDWLKSKGRGEDGENTGPS
jgi:hypothetical protein